MTWFADPMRDPLGDLIVEVRADPDVAALVGTRVRGFEPRGTSDAYEGDALGPGEYKAFVILAMLDAAPHPNGLPVTFADVAARCYGATPQNASAVYGALVKALHKTGTRGETYQTLIASGGSQEKDPDTGQPLVTATIRLVAATHAVAP